MLPDIRPAAVATAAMLAGYGSVLWLTHVTPMRVDMVVLAVVLAVTIERTQRGADLVNRGIALVVLPIVTAGAYELMTGDIIGSAAFTVAVSATIWVRRFGPRATVAGTVATAPLLATLILSGVPVGRTPSLWPALVAVIAFAWVTVAHVLTGQVKPAEAPTRRSRVSTRMAGQMGVSVAVAFVVGHVVLGEHWPWVVLTAFIVCSGNRGRVDVLNKSILRVLGAGVGTAIATLFSGWFGPLDAKQVVAIFVLLAIGMWLRPAGYAYWACCVTAALAFLYGYFGQTATDLLPTRLGGILLGGVIGVTASWFVLPVRGAAALPAWLVRACAMVSRPIRRGPPPP